MHKEQQAKLAFVGVVGLVTLWTGVVRAGGLDPQSFWFDDLWVASLTKLGSLADAVSIPVPAPPGFLGALWVAKRLVADPEVSLQLVPFLAALLPIPLLAIVVSRLSGHYTVGVIAGSLVALSPNVAFYSVFVKQYTLDVLATSVLLWLGLRYLQSREPRHLRDTSIAGIGALLFSFPSVFFSVVVVNLALLVQLPSIEREPARAGPVIRTAIAFDVVLALVFVVAIAPRSNDAVVGYWAGGFLPLDSVNAAWRFLTTRGLGALRGAFPPVPAPVLVLVPVGLGWLLAKSERRLVGVSLLLFYAAVVVTSGLRLYPISGGRVDQPTFARTDLFSYPVTILLLALGVGALTSWVPRRVFIQGSLGALVVGLVLLRPPSATYFPLDHSSFVPIMDELAGDEHAIVLWPPARFLGGYYTRWPITARVAPGPNRDLEVHLVRPHTLTLPVGPPEQMTTALETFMTDGDYRRIVYLTTRAGPGQEAPILRTLTRWGYRESQRWSSNIRTHLVVYQRTVAPEAVP